MLLRLLCLVTIIYLARAEIHRARGIKPPRGQNYKFSPRSTWPPGPNLEAHPPAPPEQPSIGDVYVKEDISTSTPEAHVKEKHSKEAWIYSIVSAFIVGLSGIFPLLVIPLDVGEALKHGAPAAHLKLLLSFAVGGLLGDVFLHLLPEAWAHLKGDVHSGHMQIGLWLLGGMLTFLIIEKIFPDDEDEEGEEDDKQSQCYEELKEQSTVDTDLTDTSCSQRTPENLQKYSSLPDTVRNGLVHRNGVVKGLHSNGAPNGVVQNGVPNGVHASASHSGKPASSHQQKSHIKTSGWLNLMANIVDNFTHGLAVAGSYCVSTKVGLLTTFAILLHEIPHEVGDFAILLRSGFDRWRAAKAQLLTASGGMIGALCALTANSVQEAGDKTAWILPFTAGGFIYIALVTCVPDLLKEQNPRESVKQVLLLCCGISVMALVTLFC